MPSTTLNENDASVGVIKISDFLEFLNISFQVTDAIQNSGKTKNSNVTQLDFDQLRTNELVNSLLLKANTVNNEQASNSMEKSAEVANKKEEHHVQENGGSDRKSGDKRLRRRGNTSKSVGKNRAESVGDSSTSQRSQLNPSLYEQLDEIINEGILDSVLPFVCPNVSNVCNGHGAIKTKPSVAKTNNVNHQTDHQNGDHSTKKTGNQEVVAGASSSSGGHSKPGRRKSTVLSPIVINEKNPEPEVVIRVCDEIKGVSRDFSCPQKLLVSKMGYFADVTAGQRLEDMDISVHCDLQIFEWLMKWVKKDSLQSDEHPSLDPSNVVPILVSASFLQMEPLLNDCLSFCHGRLNEIIKASANLSCLNDQIITRLAAMFTNLELEAVKDKKDRIAPRIWAKMIQSLCEVEPQSLRGQWASLAGLFRCSKCNKFLTQTMASYVHCVPQNMRLNRWGQLVSAHVRDPGWNLTTYVSNLHKELKSWRRVYWRLWGHCHFLYCALCEIHFPVYQMLWCQFHPDQPQFLGPTAAGNPTGPIGRYPCCGQQASRYDTLPGPQGCQHREHTVQAETDRDRAILQLCLIASENGNLYETPPAKPFVSSASAESWWSGISLLPRGTRQGLLPIFHVDGEINPRQMRKFFSRQTSMSCLESSSDTESSDYDRNMSILTRSSSDSSDGEESEFSSPRPFHSKGAAGGGSKHAPPTATPKVSYGRHWSGELSARSNQDNQREFEERAMKQVVAMVGSKMGGDQAAQAHQAYQMGGLYVRLESEWRESVRQRNNTRNKNGTK